MWKAEQTEQAETMNLQVDVVDVSKYYVVNLLNVVVTKAKVNIPALSARTIERDIASSEFSVGANGQVHVNVFNYQN